MTIMTAGIDTKEVECGTGPLDALSYPQDFDGDSLCDAVDTDDDGDKWSDTVDVFSSTRQNGSIQMEMV